MTPLKVGELLKWKTPMTEDEETQRFLVVEDRDERVLVMDTRVARSDDRFKATECYNKNDLEIAK